MNYSLRLIKKMIKNIVLFSCGLLVTVLVSCSGQSAILKRKIILKFWITKADRVSKTAKQESNLTQYKPKYLSYLKLILINLSKY